LHFPGACVNVFGEQTSPFDVVIHLATHLVRRLDLESLARRVGVTALLVAGAVAVAGPTRGAGTPSSAAPRNEAPRRRATGRIEGMVEISATLTARRPDFRIYADPGSGASPPPAPPRDPIAAELRNVVLYLEGDSAKLWSSSQSSETRMRTTIAQRDERFVPHVRTVVQGSAVEFPNEDDVFHNVFSLSAAALSGRGFDLGRYPKGSSRSVTFAKPGLVQVFCHIHPDMSAFVLVLSHPYFASPGEDHRFVIDDVPEGDYTIVGWHERAKRITHRVHVVAGQTTSIDINIPVQQGGSSGR
jgi:plastocyanin